MAKVIVPLEINFDAGDAAPSLARPKNVARSALHVATGLFSLSLIRLLPGRYWLLAIAGSFAVLAWSMEIARRHSPRVNGMLMRFFGPVAHTHERHHTNSSTWYVTALTLLAMFAPLRGAELAVLVLGFADPAAGAIGRRFGRTKLTANRTLEGTLAFVVTGFIVAYGWLLVSGAPPRNALWVSLIAATVGALAELGSSRWFDDNFAIPVAVAGAVSLSLVGLPL